MGITTDRLEGKNRQKAVAQQRTTHERSFSINPFSAQAKTISSTAPPTFNSIPTLSPVMVAIESLDHPAVEVTLPLDETHHTVEIPQETTLFLWGALAVGTDDRLPPTQTPRGSSLFLCGESNQDQIEWAASTDQGGIPLLMDSYYREHGYKGMAWWNACTLDDLPVTIDVHFQTTGPQPTVDGDPLVFWTQRGNKLPWGESIDSTIELRPATQPRDAFSTRRESLWNRHTVIRPRELT